MSKEWMDRYAMCCRCEKRMSKECTGPPTARAPIDVHMSRDMWLMRTRGAKDEAVRDAEEFS